MRPIYVSALVLALVAFSASRVQAQAATESATLNAHSAMAAQSIKPPAFPTIRTGTGAAPADQAASAAKQAASPHLMARTGPPLDELNRKDFEDNAGDRAGKLLLRSAPAGAEIFINDRLVGSTPLLMVIAPGKYSIDMRGPRLESGHSNIGVMPKETQTVLINLNQRYPTSVSAR